MKKTINRFVLVLSVAFLVIGATLLFVPQIKAIHLSYFMCGIIVAGGIYSIVHYFMTDAYKETSDYGFSIGVFLTVLGIIGFLKSSQIVNFLPGVISILALLFGVIILQDGLDMKRMERQWWLVELLMSSAVILTATILLIDPFSEEYTRQTVSSSLLLGNGVLMLVSKFALKASIKAYEKGTANYSERKLQSKCIDVLPDEYRMIEEEEDSIDNK